MIRLIQEFGAHTGRQLTFDQDIVHIGRAPTNEVPFDPNVDLDSSAHHCDLVREDGVYFVADAKSTNGTYLNGNRVSKQRLQNGDVVECGRGGPRLRIELPQPTVAAMPPAHAPMQAFNPVAPSGGGGGAYGAPPGSGPASYSSPNFGAPTAGGFGGHPPHAPQPQQLHQQQQQHSGPHAPQQQQQHSGPYAPQQHPGYGPPPGNHGGAPPGYGAALPQQYGGAPPGSIGAAVAAKLPPGAQIGKRTVAMMIDAALVQSGVRKNGPGTKVAMIFMVVLLLAGLTAGGYFLWLEKQDTDERLSRMGGGDGAAGERITQQYEAAIYMLARARAGLPPQGFCTGFAVTADLISTNAHCVDVAQQMVAQGNQIVALRNNGRGAQMFVQPVYRDPRFHNASAGLEGSGFDVGLMRSSQPMPTTVRLASVAESMTVRPGARIYVYGFPGLTMNEVSPVATITEGVLNRTTDFFDRAADPPLAQKVQHTAQTTSGSSGSPIFLANGTVVAINAGSLADEERQSMIDPRTGQRVSVEVNRSSNFKYGMRSDLIRAAIQSVGETPP